MFTKRKLNVATKAIATSIAAAGLVACGGADNPTLDTTKPVINYGEVRMLNAVADSPNLTVTIGGDTVFLGTQFGQAKPFFGTPVGEDLEIVIEASVPDHYRLDPSTGQPGLFKLNPDTQKQELDPDGEKLLESSAVLYKDTITITEGSRQDIVVSGAVNVANINDTTVEEGDTIYDLSTNALTVSVADTAAAGITVGHFANASSAVAVDVFASASEDCSAITEAPIVNALAYDATTVVAVDDLPEEYSAVCVRNDADNSLLYNTPVSALADGMWISAIDNTSGVTGASALALTIQNGASASVVYDEDDGADIRAVNASQSNDPVDVQLSGTSIGDGALEFATFTAGAANGPVNFASNTGADDVAYQLDIEDAATDSILEKPVTDIALADGQTMTAIAYDFEVDEVTKSGALLVSHDNRAVATEGRLRVIHAAKAGAVDVYLNIQDGGTSVDLTEAGVEPSIAGFDTTDDTGYLSLEAGTYDLVVFEAGDEDRTTPLLSATITSAKGGIYTLVVTDDTATTVQAISLDDAI
ncbi:DUF4397 domain-containing protein [Bermanella sp. R86510]|uniref:DUF4397 domain-containing protein n=1 Tax=unclassified Bermanella TaxID=2627862 RepID=UPI0037C86337